MGLLGFLFTSAHAQPPEVLLPEKNLIFLEDYCLDCHDSATRKGKVDLEELPFHITTIEQAELWQKVLNSLNSGEMPPEDKDQPGNVEKADFLDDLANTMVVARKALADSGGRITMRRLNRREYQNTIESLTGLRVDVDSLPADGGGGTFDTVGSSQFISSDQLEQYLTLGRAAIDEAFERQVSPDHKPKVFRVEPEKTVNASSLKSLRQLEETQKRFMRWKAGVDKAAAAPENREIMARILKENPKLDPSAFPAAAGFMFYWHASELIGAPDPKKFGFKDDNAATFSFQGGYSRKHAYLKHYAGLPHNDRGTYLKLAWGIQRIDVSPKPKDLPPGTYTLRVRAGVVEGSPSSRHFIEVGHPQRVNQVPAGLTGAPIASRQVTGTIENPEIIEIQVQVNAHTPREFSIQERQPNNPKSLRDAFNRDKRKNGYGTPPAIWIDWVELVGPIRKAGPPKSKTVRVEPEKYINPFNEKQAKKIEDDQIRFSRWKVEVDKAIATPANQERIKELVKKNPQMGHPIHFYKFVELLEGVPDASDFGFKDAFEATLAHPDWDRSELAYHKHYLSLPHRDRGTYLKLVHGTGRLDFNAKDYKPGTYIFRIRAGAVEGAPASRRFIEVGHPGLKRGNPATMSLSGAPLSKHQVTGTIAEPQIIETKVEVSSHTPRQFSVRERQPDDPMALWEVHNRLKRENGYGHPPAIWIDWMEMEGPLPEGDGSSRIVDEWVAGKPGQEETERARSILEKFAVKAMRGREPGSDYINRLLGIFESRRKAGEPFNIAIRSPLSIILASPGFLYLHEPGSEDERRQLDDRELAVRLSYFLWSMPPDERLLDLAKQGELSKPDVLRREVDRLIADPRSDEFIAGFVHQWLDMERLDFFQFDPNLHREFDESTRAATREEVYQSFAHLLRGGPDGRLDQLLKTDHVFINGLLATYYGIEGVSGDEFRKVTVPADSPRGGLLGMAAIHAMGSDGIESSPVERGAWVLRHLLNDPPPPAPPNVPQLSRLAHEPLNTRDKLAAHMEEAQCATCHRKIDPIGFGMENFDAAGKWRTIEKFHTKDKNVRRSLKGKKTSWPIDPSGKLHKGPAFADYFELRDIIAGRDDDFARGFTEHLIEYALGRPFGFTDEDLANEVMAAAKSKDYAAEAFIHALVQSRAFQQK